MLSLLVCYSTDHKLSFTSSIMAANQVRQYSRLLMIEKGIEHAVMVVVSTENDETLNRSLQIIRGLDAMKKIISYKRPQKLLHGSLSDCVRYGALAPELSPFELAEVDHLQDIDENHWMISFCVRENEFYCRRAECNHLYAHTIKSAKEHWVAVHFQLLPPANAFEVLLIRQFLGRQFERGLMDGESYICPVCEKVKTVLDSRWSYVKHLKEEHADTLEPMEVARFVFADTSRPSEPISQAFWNSMMHPMDTNMMEEPDSWMCLCEDCNNFYPLTTLEMKDHYQANHSTLAAADIKRHAEFIKDCSQFYLDKGNYRFQCCFQECNNESVKTCFESLADSARHLELKHTFVFAHIWNSFKKKEEACSLDKSKKRTGSDHRCASCAPSSSSSSSSSKRSKKK